MTTAMFWLPVEIWSRIFAYSIDDNPGCIQVLMGVNHTFRSITNSTPQLWTRLEFKEHNHFTDLPRARSLLQKSGLLPLDLLITIPTSVDPEILTPLAALLRDHVQRLRTLQLSDTAVRQTHDFLTVIGEGQPAPLLERLDVLDIVAYFEDEHGHYFAPMQNPFCPAPRLTHLSLPAFPPPASSWLPLLPTIRDFTLNTTMWGFEIDLVEAIKLFSSMPLVERFTFKAPDLFSHTDPDLLPVASVPYLHHADVTGPGYGLDILCRLDAPHLKNVRVDGLSDFGHRDPVALSLHDLSKSHSSITHLELAFSVMIDPIDDYPWIFGGDAFPNLEFLRLHATDITDDALQLCVPSATLRKLGLFACMGISNAGISLFTEGCREGFEIFVDSCRNVTRDITRISKSVKVEFTCDNWNVARAQEGYAFWT